MSDKRNNERVDFTCTTELLNAIKAAAEEEGLSVASYIRMMLLRVTREGR